MRSFKVWGWAALLSVSVLSACGGVSKIGSGSGGGSSTAGSANSGVDSDGGSSLGGGKMGTAAGGMSVGTGGKSAVGGMGAGAEPGAGATSTSQSCMDSEECPGAHDPCQICEDGHQACNNGYCDSDTHTCKRLGAICQPKCVEDTDCPASELACADCGDGTRACPTSQCRAGRCEVTYPGCNGYEPCTGRVCGYICSPCPDGSCSSSVLSFCNGRGQCRPGPENCNQNSCATKQDCGTAPPECVPCVDGSCAIFDCRNNACALACPGSALQCKHTDDCLTAFDPRCQPCQGGQCAVPVCYQGACQLACPLE